MIFKNINIKSMIFIVIMTAIIAFSYNYFSANGIKLFINDQEQIELKKQKISKLQKINFVSLETAKRIYDDNIALFIDARDQWEYADGHIFNSINIPEFSFSPYLPIVKSLDKNGYYVIYCSSQDCDLSRNLATRLQDLEFKNISVFSGGWESWVKANLPIFRK